MVGPAVIDTDDQRLAVPDVGDAGIARDRQGRMRSRQRGHVKNLAIGGQPAVEIIAVPGGHALGAVVRVFLGNIDAAGHRIGLADPVGAAALRHGIAERHHARARGHPVFGIDTAGEFVRRGAIGKEKARCHGNDTTRRQDDRFWPSNPHRPQLPFSAADCLR